MSEPDLGWDGMLHVSASIAASIGTKKVSEPIGHSWNSAFIQNSAVAPSSACTRMACTPTVSDASVIPFHAYRAGVASLDDWLCRRALVDPVSGASRLYVVTTQEDRVAGYDPLASGALAHTAAPGRIRLNIPDLIPVAVLGRLAVDRSMQGQGLGVALRQDAVMGVQQAASIVGIRGILVHAISAEARAFYEHHGFTPSETNPLTLILSVARAGRGP